MNEGGMTGKVAVVTGASRGIGRAIAEALAAQGWQVIGLARKATQLPGIDMRVCDVTDRAAVADAFAVLPRVDLLVNNAGAAGGAAFGSAAELAGWDGILAANLTASYLCAAASRDKLPDGSGRIVNIASVLGLRGVPDQLAYTAAKHGVVGLTKALALALAPRRITVNAICPGWVDTDMAQARFKELGISAKDAAASTPTGRISTPQDIASLVLYLASAAAGNLTGQALAVDGGAML